MQRAIVIVAFCWDSARVCAAALRPTFQVDLKKNRIGAGEGLRGSASALITGRWCHARDRGRGRHADADHSARDALRKATSRSNRNTRSTSSSAAWVRLRNSVSLLQCVYGKAKQSAAKTRTPSARRQNLDISSRTKPARQTPESKASAIEQ